MFQEDDTSFEAEYTLEIGSATISDSRQKNEKNITLIWFNPITNTTDDINKIKEELWTVNNVVLFPTDINSCISDIKSRDTEKIFLIISSNIAPDLLPDIIDFSQLDAIFILSENRNKFNYLRDDYCKVVDIFGNSNDLLRSVQQNITLFSGQMQEVYFHEPHQQSTRDLSTESSEFLWFQLFIDVILHLPPDNKAKEEMLTACRHHYQNNRGRLKVIDEFDQTYHINECIRWYTKETFVYELINSALRTGDIEKLYTFRYYIADLSNQLAEKSKNSKWGRDQLINLYRGTKINKKEADKFKINDGKLIATNSYWSTSRDRDYACTYANKLAHHADLVSVLFEIECSLMNQNDSIVVVDISELSEFPSENEFLFDVGSIFQIQKVTKETNGDTELYVVELSTTEDGREVVKKYIEENRREMEYESPKMMVGILLKRIGEYKKSLQYFEQLLIDPGEENIAYIHNRIGIAYRNENKDDLALDHFNKALSLSSKVQPSEKRLLANILQNIGKVDYKHKRFNSALEYYRQAVDTIGPEKGDMNRLIAELYSSIGRVSIDLKDYESAHKHLQNALEIRQSCLPSDHFINAFSYADIAKIYWCQKNPELALENHRKALELRQNYLPANHINTAWSLHYVGKMYYKNRNLETALDYYLKSLEMTRKCLPPPQHHTVPKILESIALIYNDKKNFNEALEYRFEALEVQKKTEPIDYSNLAHILDNIAFTYRLMNRKKDSLTFYQKALQVLTDNLSDDNLNLSYTFKHLASLYEAMNDIRSALIYYRKELKIYQHHRLYRDKRYKKTRRNIKRLSMHKI